MNYLEETAAAIRAEVDAEALPDDDTHALFVGYAVLLLAKGSAVTGEDVHNAWTAWMTVRGEDHPAMVPFADLPSETQAEDSPFAAAIRRVAAQQ